MRVRLVRAIAAAMMISVLICSQVMAAPDIDTIRQDKEAAESEVSEIQKELQALVEKTNQLESDLLQKGEEIAQAEAELEEAQERELQQYADMKLRIQYMYEEGDGSLIETLLSAENFSDLLNKAEYVQNIHSYDRQKLQEYIETKQQIADLKYSLEQEQMEMETLQAEYITEQEGLNQTLIARQNEVANLEEELQAAVEAAEKERQEEEARRQAENGAAAAEGASAGADSASGSSYIPPSGSGSAGVIVAAAQSYLGTSYVYGGSSYSGIDCSGLVMKCLAAAGISVSHYSGSIGAGGTPVSEPLPGDIVCYVGHVGVYVGNGQMIHAPQPGQSVCYSSVDFAPHWYRRYW